MVKLGSRKRLQDQGPEIQQADGSEDLSSDEVALYRSLVGGCVYLSQERLVLSFATKELGCSMSKPTATSKSRMKKLVGYLKSKEGQRVKISFPTRGRGMRVLSTQKWLLETFTDADWRGRKGHGKSTSSSVHVVNGCVVKPRLMEMATESQRRKDRKLRRKKCNRPWVSGAGGKN